jgi:hypothetical protein
MKDISGLALPAILVTGDCPIAPSIEFTAESSVSLSIVVVAIRIIV